MMQFYTFFTILRISVVKFLVIWSYGRMIFIYCAKIFFGCFVQKYWSVTAVKSIIKQIRYGCNSY